MSFEKQHTTHESVEGNDDDFEIAAARHGIESALISHACMLDDEVCVQDWLDENNTRFHQEFDRLLVEDPGMIKKWDNNRAQVLEVLRERLKDQGRGGKKK